MCSIAGAIALNSQPIPELSRHLRVMDYLLRHRGPDAKGKWLHPNRQVGFTHRRLSIIDLETGDQPMCDMAGNWIVYNGEIYNYLELRQELGSENFVTVSDTEVILHAYRKWGIDCLQKLRGMFSFALWDEANHRLFCARDRFGIKPFYYSVINNVFYFASEIKALLPFLRHIETDLLGLKDYLTFQLCLEAKTLFKGIKELSPAHHLIVSEGNLKTKRYWDVYYDLDFNHDAKYFEQKLSSLFIDSVNIHLRSDVPLGAYVSGGMDSSAVAALAMQQRVNGQLVGFTGKFSSFGPEFDESLYARILADGLEFELYEIDITAKDFIDHIRDVIYYLDYPVAGPGAFSQYMVSRLAAQYRKTVLSGLGGDEIFGGYARYLIAYFEQCIKGAIEGTMHSGNFIVTYESIIPNLIALRNYKPLMKSFWREGLFNDMDARYYRLINRATGLGDEINWELLGDYQPFEKFKAIFNGDNVSKASYFDLMTNFDFKTLLPALLHVEDRMSMAHGLESRVPLLDHPLVELAATVPSNIKFKNGTMKHIFKQVVRPLLPQEIYNRKDKMGFPTPLTAWMQGEASDFVQDLFSSSSAKNRELMNNNKILEGLNKEGKFDRKVWGLLSLELWQQSFHDRENDFKKLLTSKELIP
ncbi:asparagine synthase (glutamine-hydrolyzing) [Thermodesulfobacteriota bacterium]